MVHKTKNLIRIPKDRQGEIAKLVGNMGGAVEYQGEHGCICTPEGDGIEHERAEEIADAVRKALNPESVKKGPEKVREEPETVSEEKPEKPRKRKPRVERSAE